MVRMLVVVLATICVFIVGCGQEQPAGPAPARPEAKPAGESAAPPPPPAPQAAPATPATAPAPPEAAKPAAPSVVQEATKPAAAPKPPVEAKPATAAPASSKPVDVATSIILAASQGQVTLPHLAHAKLFPCATCHGDGTPGKIDLTKDTAHELCRDCHKAKGAGPTACGECHKK